MNTTITLAITTLAITLLSSCQKYPEDLVIDKVQESLLDPKTFELIKCEPKDTNRVSDTIDAEINHMTFMVQSSQERLDLIQGFLNGGSYWWESEVQTEKGILKERKNRLKELQTLKSEIEYTEKDTILHLEYYVSCYAANKLGMKSIHEFRVFWINDDHIEVVPIPIIEIK